MRIMSFNIRCSDVNDDPWENRVGIVAKTILESGSDTVGVQEAHNEWMKALEKALGDKYDYIGVGRDDGKQKGEYSAIFYLKEKYEVVESGTFWLSEKPNKPSYGWDAKCRRVCTWGVFENKETKEKFVHFNTHFDHIGVAARRNSVEMIVERAKSFAALPVVFTADMNVEEGSENYNQFVNSGFFRDTKKIAPDTMNCCTYHDTEPEKHAKDIIDYVMINDKFKAFTYKVMTEGIDGRFVSDHYPIYADIEIC